MLSGTNEKDVVHFLQRHPKANEITDEMITLREQIRICKLSHYEVQPRRKFLYQLKRMHYANFRFWWENGRVPDDGSSSPEETSGDSGETTQGNEGYSPGEASFTKEKYKADQARVLCQDSTFGSSSRYDCGPVSISFFLFVNTLSYSIL